MKPFLIIFFAILFSSCKNNQSDSIVQTINQHSIKYDISKIDSLIKSELTPVDSIIFNKYIANNPVILGQNFDSPRLYADGFWIKKYADSLKHNIIFNTFRKAQYYLLKHPLKQHTIKGFMIMVIYPVEKVVREEHLALYLITLVSKDSYPSTVLLAEKIKGGGLVSIDLITSSTINDSNIIEQTTIERSCILDLPGPNGELTCNYDTAITYYKMTDRCIFYPYKRKVTWEIKQM
jgi:hypothetical protein